MKTKISLADYAITVTVIALILFWVSKSLVLPYLFGAAVGAIVVHIFKLRKTIAELKNSLDIEEIRTRVSEHLLNRAEKRLAKTFYRCNACKRFIGKGKEHILGDEEVLCEECYQKERKR